MRRALLIVLGIGCGTARSSGDPDAAASGGDGSGSGTGGDSSNGSGNQDGCGDAAKLVYVVDSSNKLSTFDPMTKTFRDVGNLSCPAGLLARPFSMSLDRDAIAWVLYNNGELFRVDTATLGCTKSQWTTQSGLQAGLLFFGMSFSTDTVGGTTDTLFISGGNSQMSNATLAKLSLQTFTAMPIGTVAGWPELTGTGNAELWGWFPDASAPRIQQLDKASGAGLTMYALPQLAGTPSAWAFAFWGGDFWVFLQRMNETSTTIHQVDGATGAIESSTAAPGRRIVGAGVSTCAPVILL